jgi:hypothetical protein
VGARGDANELVSFAGRTLPAVPPQLEQLSTGSRTHPLAKLRPMRATLNQLNQFAKTERVARSCARPSSHA